MASDCVCMYVCFCVCVCDCVCQLRARAQRFYIYTTLCCVWGGRPLSLLLSNVYYRVLRGSLFSVCVSVCASAVCVRADYMSACAHAHAHVRDHTSIAVCALLCSLLWLCSALLSLSFGGGREGSGSGWGVCVCIIQVYAVCVLTCTRVVWGTRTHTHIYGVATRMHSKGDIHNIQ
jgi:hypothetical protein